MANAGGRPTAPVVLEPEEREYLERQVRRRRVSRSMSERCRILLRCADGIQSKVVAAELGVHEHTVGKGTVQLPGVMRHAEKAVKARMGRWWSASIE